MTPVVPAFSPALSVKGGHISARREIPAFVERGGAQPKQSLMMKHTRFAGAACF